MKKNKYKILVLTDLKDSTSTTIKSTISLSKMIDGDIELFYVKNASDVVKQDNQLSAIRTINGEYRAANKKIQNLIKSVSDDYHVTINYRLAIGNVKNEIVTYIEEHQPDIIVLGKRKSKPLNFIGDNITDFILKTHNGVIMIAANENPLEPNKKLSLGILNGIEQTSNIVFAEDLISYAQKPLKLFKIIKSSNTTKETNSLADKQTVEYVFEHGDNSISTLSNYLSKKNINLLCIDRDKKDGNNKVNTSKLDIKDVISKLNVSLLLSGNSNSYLH
ncbi:universal stress protein [Yeosuana marina]|uniref:universal stress protein n=1 Tax=Yeosuana marina TaxID=1565536 RepID=UPI0030EF39D3|tara:strand:+ start:868 stop:1695 length:828 start_codon:yes stop_codon:yes gene_type:complete